MPIALKLRPWFMKKEPLLYGVGCRVIWEQNSPNILAYFVSPDTMPVVHSKVLFPWGCLPQLIPGYLYADGIVREASEKWINGMQIVNGEFSLSKIRPSDPAFKPYSIMQDIPAFCVGDLEYQQCFDFTLEGGGTTHYLVPSTEVIRTFFAPTTDAAMKLVSPGESLEDYLQRCDLLFDTLRMTLDPEAPAVFKNDSALAAWLGWIISTPQLVEEWLRIKKSTCSENLLKARIPAGLRGKVRYRGLKFPAFTLILSMSLSDVVTPFRHIELQYTCEKRTSSVNTVASDAGGGSKLPDTAEILADSEGARPGHSYPLYVPLLCPAFKNVGITRKRTEKNVSGSAAAHTAARRGSVVCSVQKPQPDGSAPQGNLAPMPAPLQSMLNMDCPEELNDFLKAVVTISNENHFSGVEAKAFQCRAPVSHSCAWQNYMIFRAQCMDCHGHIKTIAALEVGTAPARRVSTLVFRCSASEKLENLGQAFLKQYSRDGHWDCSARGMENVSLVRHCRNYSKALERHIKSL